MDDDADEIMDTRPLISLDNFVNNRPDTTTTTTYYWLDAHGEVYCKSHARRFSKDVDNSK